MSEDEIERQCRELERLQSEIKNKEDEIERQNKTVEFLDRRIKVKLGAIKNHELKIQDLESEIRKKSERMQEVDNQLQEYETRLQKQNDELAEIADNERRRLDEELNQQRAVVARQAGELAARIEQAERDRQFLDTEKKQLAAVWEEFERQRAEWRQEIAAKENEQREQLHRQVIDQQRREQEAIIRLEEEQRELLAAGRTREQQLRRELAQLQDLAARLEEVERERDDLRDRWRTVGGGSPAEVEERLQNERDNVKRLQEQVARLQHEIGARASADAQRLPALEKELSDTRQTCAQLQRIIDADRIAADKVENLRRKEEWLNAKIETLEHIITEQSKQLQELKARTEEAKQSVQRIRRGTEAFAQRAGDIEAWEDDTLAETVREADEAEWLQEIAKGVADSGLQYSRRLLDSFHTCLKIAKWSPITVLSGVSGTGKSALPQLYARFGGFHFESVPVRSNWNSPEDAFGFFNYMENRFAARPLLRRMAQSQSGRSEGKPGFAGELLMVLLDEMNLAQIELYLSDLLSRWELRRGEDKPVMLEFDLGPDCETYPLTLGTNMLFTGTINEDETTQALSDKLLDRGNLLYFPRPKSLKARARLQLAEPAPPLAERVWNSWCRNPSTRDEHPLLFEICDRLREATEEINRCVGAVTPGFGHRLWQSIEVYIVNHPAVAALRDETRGALPADGTADEATTALRNAALRAFEDQVVQRIVPKLRGVPLEGATRRHLDELATLLREHAPGVADDFQASLSPGLPSFVWRQSSYLDDSSYSSDV